MQWAPESNLHCEHPLLAPSGQAHWAFDDVEDISIEHFYFDNGFYTELSANASGHHYKEEGVSDRSMTVSIILQCDVLVGKFGLGPIEQGEVNGTLDGYD